jgi:uncharacterized membrane protein
MEELVKSIALLLGNVVEGVAAVLIAHGVIRTTFQYIAQCIRKRSESMDIRMRLGKLLALSLELLLAADILRTAVAPTWDEIGKLGSIAALRTWLNYFLERELKKSEQES